MIDYNFLTPTSKYKVYQLLSTIESGASLTQRDIAKELGIAPSMVNMYLNECVSNGYVEKVINSKKDVKFHITKSGIEEKRNLNVEFLKSSLNVYNIARQNIYPFFERLNKLNINDVVFYGAGEVCEMLLCIINTDKSFNFNIVSIVDDDSKKIGSSLLGLKIESPETLNNKSYDAVVISSYNNSNQIFNRLNELNIDKSTVVKLVEEV